MQRCTNELYWLDQQAKGRMQYDWSDRNLDYPSRRRQYEVGSEGDIMGAARRIPETPPRACPLISHRTSSIGTWRPRRRESTSCIMRGTSYSLLSTRGETLSRYTRQEGPSCTPAPEHVLAVPAPHLQLPLYSAWPALSMHGSPVFSPMSFCSSSSLWGQN